MPAAKKYTIAGSNTVHIQNEDHTGFITYCHQYLNLRDWVIDEAKVTCPECIRAVKLHLGHLQKIVSELN